MMLCHPAWSRQRREDSASGISGIGYFAEYNKKMAFASKSANMQNRLQSVGVRAICSPSRRG
jgi:hypothetical protein